MSESPAWKAVDDRFPRLYWRLDDAAWEAFGRFGTTHELDADATLFEEGTTSISLFLVQDGEVAIRHRDHEIARVGQNFSFGEMGLLLDRPRGGSAVTTKPSRLLELTRADLQAMQEKEPVWSTRLYRVLAECLAEYLQQAARDLDQKK